MIAFFAIHCLLGAFFLWLFVKTKSKYVRLAAGIPLVALPIVLWWHFINRYVILAQLFFALGDLDASKSMCKNGVLHYRNAAGFTRTLIDESYLWQCQVGFGLSCGFDSTMGKMKSSSRL